MVHQVRRRVRAGPISSSIHTDFVLDALAETINGLHKAELIHRPAPSKTGESVKLPTLQWVRWLKHHRLLEPIGYIPPAETKANYAGQAATAEV